MLSQVSLAPRPTSYLFFCLFVVLSFVCLFVCCLFVLLLFVCLLFICSSFVCLFVCLFDVLCCLFVVLFFVCSLLFVLTIINRSKRVVKRPGIINYVIDIRLMWAGRTHIGDGTANICTLFAITFLHTPSLASFPGQFE